MNNSIEWSSTLFNRYHRPDQQYSSYPALEQFQHSISAFERFSALRTSRKASRKLALSINSPLYANAHYNGIDKNSATKVRSYSSAYLRSLEQEIRIVAQHISTEKPIEQLHFSAATASLLSPNELRQLMSCLKNNFNIISNNFAQYSIDIDPSKTDWSMMGVLRCIGFNRVNIEVQGLIPTEQTASNRLHSIEQTQNIVDAARTLQFRTVSISLIYGLAKQSALSFAQSLHSVIQLMPDRIILQSLERNSETTPQHTDAENLQSPSCIEQMLRNAQQQLNDAGYRYIGMGNFALADDDFASAQEDGTLQLGTQGYSTCPNCDTIGFGVSAISQFGELYYHNTDDLAAYQTACSNQQLASAYGLLCNTDDQIRRSVIQALTCQFSIAFAKIEQPYTINFKDYFRGQWPHLEQMHNDGLISLSDDGLHMTAQGRLFTLAVCQLFDHYFAQKSTSKPCVTQAI